MGHQIKNVLHFRDQQPEHEIQNFDRKKISFVKYGKEINVYDYIQSNNVDTDIYEVAKKYNNGIVDVTTLTEFMNKNLNEVSNEFDEYMDLRTVLDKQIKAQNMWEKLPLSVKNVFNNDKNEFIDKGQQWIKSEQEKLKSAEQKKNEAQQQQTGTSEGVK